ncbi:PP2C family protein-serine/threonine phosphatase [Streptomyces minutiscleroticus]|uniref:PP2C family protein-serine/threonine phosphatase n=1 Tax=Streptomyces minutiscleroticus TaxID=68238 RepID=UPI003329E630
MARSDGGRTPADDWSARLHGLWRAALDVEAVEKMSRHIYALMLDEPGVVAVVGSRWDGGELRYVRHMTPDGGRPVLRTRRAGPGAVVAGPGRTAPKPGAGHEGDGPAVLHHDLTGPDGGFAPEHALFVEAGARHALEVRFSFGEGDGDGDWAAFSVGLERPQDAAPGLATRLTQLAEVLVASNRRVLDHRAHERQQIEDAFLAEASLQMDASLDVQETLGRIARLAVPALAEGCVVHLFQEGRLSLVASAHVAAAAQPWLVGVAHDAWLEDRIRAAADRRLGSVVSGGDLAGSPFGPRAGGPGRAVRAVSVTPLRARGKVLGTLAFVHHRDARDLPSRRLLDDLAQRAALAIDTTAAYEQRRRNAEQLQRHLLPGTLPEWPGVSLSAAYEVADDSLEVGGDFYDAVVRRDGGLALFIGDVCGRGAEAAALTGLARHTLRVLLEDGASPADALSRLNAVLVAQSTPRFVTALAAVITPESAGRTLEAASAGHPRPLVRRADGRVTEVGVSGLLLGVLGETRYEPVTVPLAAGDSLALFTDGLTEARSADGTMFEELLPQAVRDCCRGDDDAAAALIARASRFRALGDDDTAVLVAYVKGDR